MISRLATLVAATLLFSASAAYGKVAPTLDAQQSGQDKILQQLIIQPQTGKSCEVGQLRDLVAPAGKTLTTALGDYSGVLCPIPAPPANPFGNVALL